MGLQLSYDLLTAIQNRASLALKEWTVPALDPGSPSLLLKGAASMAESLVTSAVEEALLGVAQFQTNPMLAASAATYAGTTTRKATQHAFLSHIPIPLG